MAADLDSIPPLTAAGASDCGQYPATGDTFAALMATAVLLGPHGGDPPRLTQDKAGAQAVTELVLAADQRADLMRALADQVDHTATLARLALMTCAHRAELTARTEAGQGCTDDVRR